MIVNLLERLLRKRYGFPLVLIGALALVLLNEWTYQHSHSALTRGIDLTDLRMKAAQTVQLVTDAETGVRGYLLTGNDEYLKPYRNALVQLPSLRDKAFELIRRVDVSRTIGVDEVRALMDAKMGELITVTEMYAAGKRSEAVAVVYSDVGMAKMSALREAFDEVLQRAGSLQDVARVSLFDALSLNRLAVDALTGVGVIGLYFLTRQLKQGDLARQQEQARLEVQVQRRTTELREIAGHLVSAREDERGRVARELHDELGALLTAAKLDIARLRRMPDLTAPMSERVNAMEKRLNDGIALKRQIVENLRPSALDQLGLIASVSLMCKDMSASLGLPIAEHLGEVKINKSAELTIYRLVQESLTNIGKYAQAHNVSVSVGMSGGEVAVSVEDDGQGFNVDDVGHGRHGLVGMRFRVESHGGRMQVSSMPGQGTRVAVFLPATTAV